MYTKTQWVDNTTPIDKDNLNKIEQGIYDNSLKLETQIVNTANTSLDDYTDEGWYFFDSSHTPLNIPNGVNGFLEVRKADVFTKQFWYRAGTPGTNDFQTFVRTKSGNNAWGAWRKYIVDSEVYYESGETVSIRSGKVGFGDITGGAAHLRFELTLNKKLTNISSVSLTSLQITVRGVSGYVIGSATGIQIIGNEEYSITSISITSDNTIFIDIAKSTAVSTTNNTPIVVYINSCTLTLN